MAAPMPYIGACWIRRLLLDLMVSDAMTFYSKILKKQTNKANLTCTNIVIQHT